MGKDTKGYLKILKKTIRFIVITGFGFALLLLIIAFTNLPFKGLYWLGSKNMDKINNPGTIVLLSGGGMPSEDGLYRVYCAAKACIRFPDANIIIVMPGDTSDIYSSIRLTADELLLRGIDSSRIFYENIGTNTRSQALQVNEKFFYLSGDSIIIVTSPIHTRRAVLSFEKAGFEHVGSYPAFERVIESRLEFRDEDLGGNSYIPDVGRSINLRYRFWGHLKLEVDLAREFLALFYYKIKGWI